jgi:hypothetical protein
MTAIDKTSPFSTPSNKEMRGEVISEPTACCEVRRGHAKERAAASERFATVLRTAPVEETMKPGLRDSRQVLFRGRNRPLWTTRFESDWRRYIRKPINPSTH